MIRFGGGFSLRGNIFKLNILDLTIDFSACEWFSSELINLNTLKIVNFTFKDNQIFIGFVFSEPSRVKETKNKEFLSIDLGISSIATIYNSVTKTPIKIQTRRFKGLEKQNNLINSKLSKKKKNTQKNKEIYSKRFKRLLITKKRVLNKLTNKRKDYLHKASKKIINICLENKIDNIIIGEIRTKKLQKNYKCKLNKSTQNEGLLSGFKSFIEYKAKGENIAFIKINEAYTSQENCITGKREFSSDMSVREVEILPSVFIDRDVNSTINIAKKYGDLWLSHDFNYENLLKLEKINISL
jgi:IS605 OrfB family transposase